MPPQALVLSAGNPRRDPRPNRMIRCLARDFSVTVLARGTVDLPGVRCLEIPPYPRRRYPGKLAGVICRRLGRKYPTIWPPGLRAIASALRAERPELIVAHSIELLPVALAIAGGRSRVWFDAREYYPRQAEDIWWWRTMFRPLVAGLCRDYLARADTVFTVSPGLADEYLREFGVRCHLLPSLPRPADLVPQPTDATRIRMIHHGQAAPSRRVDLMIDLMRLLPPTFSLDLMLIDRDSPHGRALQRRAADLPNVAFRPPVSLDALVPETNRYDIGLYLLPPTSFNTLHALPNKFFEFVQARLMIAIGPSPDMADFVRRYDLGVVADAFTPAALAARLRGLTVETIMAYKQRAHAAATILNSDRTDAILRAFARREPPPPTP